ncbi:MAG: CAP domain-containing protein [Pseudomonadota bacterium]
MLASSAFTAAACDLGVSDRSSGTPAYIDLVQDCLGVLPLGFEVDTRLEDAFLARINTARREAGLSPLALRRDLLPAARFHSLDMGVNGFFRHLGPDGRDLEKRVRALDRTLLSAGMRENIASLSGWPRFGGEDAELHRALMESPGHRANILAEAVTHCAIGVVRRGGDIWVTQVFVDVFGELDAPLPARWSSGAERSVRAEVRDWQQDAVLLAFADGQKRALQRRDNRPTRYTVPVGRRGEAASFVRVQKPLDSGAGIQFFDLLGPTLYVTGREGG